MNNEAIIFYSWQSDNGDTRNYVENGILGAIKVFSTNPELKESPRPRMDKDTQGEVGAVDIARVIHDKIDKADVFVADVSLIGVVDGDKVVNQNVMYELGYAMGKHGENKVIMVANTDLGTLKELPFDINGKKVIPFSIKDDPKRIKFKRNIGSALQSHLEQLGKSRQELEEVSIKAQLLEALDAGKPVRSKAEKYFESAYSGIAEKYPGRLNDPGKADIYAKKSFEAYELTKPIVAELYEVLVEAGEYSKEEVFTIAFRKLEILTRFYDPLPEDKGQLYSVSSEFFELVANEITQMLYGIMSLNKMWSVMGKLSKIQHDRPTRNSAPAIEQIYHLPSAINGYYNKLTGMNWSIPTTHILLTRWGDNVNLLKMIVEGGCLLFLVRTDQYGYALGLLLMDNWQKYKPSFVDEFDNPSVISKLVTASDVNDFESLRKQIQYRAGVQFADIMAFSNYSLEHLFKDAGIYPLSEIGKSGQVVQT